MNQDLALLQNINETLLVTPNANQRELAKNANVSIGLMNAVLKRFAERGWIMLKNVNARKIAYALTEEGLHELKERSKAFAKRTFALASEYNEILYEKIIQAKNAGKESVILYGRSYIKFLIEYAAEKANLVFENRAISELYENNEKIEENAFCLVGELEDENVQNELAKRGAQKVLDLIEDSGKMFGEKK